MTFTRSDLNGSVCLVFAAVRVLAPHYRPNVDPRRNSTCRINRHLIGAFISPRLISKEHFGRDYSISAKLI